VKPLGALQIITTQDKREIENMLRRYPLYKKAIEDGSLQRSMANYFPSCTSAYQERVNEYSKWKSSTERYGIKRAEKYVLVKQVEMGLGVLTQEERKIIEVYYFQPDKWPGVVEFCDQYRLSEATYHRVKREALWKMAIVWNLI
jgi:hypothetical protein